MRPRYFPRGGSGGTRAELQRYALADATEGGAAGILASAITYDAATKEFTFPIAAGAAGHTVGASRYLEWDARNALGNVDNVELEDIVRSYIRSIGPLPAECFCWAGYTFGGMAAPGGGLVAGLAGDGLVFFSPFASGAWAAPTNGGAADTLQRIASFFTGQRNAAGSGVTGAVGLVADGSPSAVAAAAAPSSTANIGSSGPWAKFAIGVGRKAVLAAPANVVVRVASFHLDLRDIPGAADFLA